MAASAVISDCDGVTGQQSRCTRWKECLTGTHSPPGQWKSELQQFLLKCSEIPGSSRVCKACECSIRPGLHGQYKGEFGLNKTSRKKSNVSVCQVVAKPPNVWFWYNMILIQYVRQQMWVWVRRKYLAHYISVQSIIMPPIHTADVLVSVHCVVVKVNTMLVMTSGRL